MSLQVWLPLNKDPNMIPTITSFSKEGSVTITEDTDGWYKITDSSHTSSRWGIYYNFNVKPNTTYTLYVYSKSTTGITASIGVQSYVGSSTWPAVRDTNNTSTEKLTTYTWTTGATHMIARIYLAMNPSITKADNYVFYKEPKIYEAPRNQGIVNTNITENGAIYRSNVGKLGGCFKTTSNAHIDLKYNGDQINTGSISFGGWFNFNKNELQERFSTYTYTDIRTTPTGNIIGNNSYGGVGLIWYANNMYDTNGILNNLYITCSIRSTNNGARATSGREIPFNTWVHLFLIFNKITKELQLWINGELVQYSIMLDFDDARSQNLMLNYNAVWGGNGPSFNIPFLVNDVRIYDHALSVQEIKELARGLVVHYPLNNNGFGNENLATCTTDQYNIPFNASNFHYFWINGDTLEPNTTYTFSAEVEVIESMDYCTIFNYSPGDYTGTQCNTFPADGKRHSWTFTTSETALGLIGYAGVAGRDANHSAIYRNIKLEKGDRATSYIPRSNESLYTKMGLNNKIVYDISGYQNNGTITGALSTTSDTPRYKTATYFNGSSYALTDTGSFSWFGFDKCTLSIWMKPTTTPNSYSGSFGIAHNSIDGYYSKCFSIANTNGKFNVQAASGGGWIWITPSYNAVADEWHHYVATLDGTAVKMYVDGELIYTTTINWNTAKTASDTKVQVGIDLPGSDETYYGYYSDARIYVTALSADDIQELYEMGVSG